MKGFFCALILFLIAGLCFGLPSPAAAATAPTTPETGCYLGLFREGAPQNMGYIKSFEKMFNKKPAMVMWYADFNSDFPLEDCESVYKYGAVPQIVWEPWIWGDDSKIKLDNIINGDWDKHIQEWASDAASYRKTVFIRWGHEFNIEKYPWGVGNNNKNPEKYVKAYRHIHDIFKKAGATNIKWIWCFNNYPNPNENWNSWDLAYPGDDYVDWIGIDGYNWGTTQIWSGWQSFKEMFRDQVREASKRYPTKPVMIAEFGSCEEGGNKANWIKDILPTLKISMPQVKALVMFDTKKECDWRVNSSKKSQDAYQSLFNDKYILSSPEGLINLSVAKNPFLPGEARTAVAKKAQYSLKMNGDFGPFSGCTPIVMDNDTFLKEGSDWKGPKDLSAKIYLMWDSQFFYMYAKITDNLPLTNSKTNGDIWNGDGIEVTLPGYQIGFGTGDGRANKPSIWIWQKRKPSTGEIFVTKTIDPTGYVLEAKVPWKEIGSISPKTGDKTAFDIAVDDADQTWERKQQFVWSGDYLFYKDQDVWGALKFEE
jgi:Carbohydrate family 9 binding domain-like/Glycosyl hydrolase family 26